VAFGFWLLAFKSYKNSQKNKSLDTRLRGYDVLIFKSILLLIVRRGGYPGLNPIKLKIIPDGTDEPDLIVTNLNRRRLGLCSLHTQLRRHLASNFAVGFCDSTIRFSDYARITLISIFANG
jgi:hypothetical protein